MFTAKDKERLKSFFCGSYSTFLEKVLKERNITRENGNYFNSQFIRLVINLKAENEILEKAIVDIEFDLKNPPAKNLFSNMRINQKTLSA